MCYTYGAYEKDLSCNSYLQNKIRNNLDYYCNVGKKTAFNYSSEQGNLQF
jgi:hypothetical protein